MKGIVDDELLKSLAESMNIQSSGTAASSSAKGDGKPQQDYQDQKLWREVHFEMQMMVWAVVNDGVITDGEMAMMMNVLKSHGVPDNQHTYQMLKGFLENEVVAYEKEYNSLDDVEKERQLEREREIKEEIKEKLRQEARKARAIWRDGGRDTTFVKQILHEKEEKKLARTLEDMLGFMGFETERRPEVNSFVTRFNESNYQQKAQQIS